MSNELKVYIPGKNAKEHTISFNSIIPGITGEHQVIYMVQPGKASTITNNTNQTIHVSLNSKENLTNRQTEHMQDSITALSMISVVMFLGILALSYNEYKRNENGKR